MAEKAHRTVRELAGVVGIPVDRMLVQLKDSGLSYTDPDQPINEEDKTRLLSHLRNRHGTSSKKSLSLSGGRRKISVSEIRVSSSQGRHKTVTVEVRNRVRVSGGRAEGAKNSDGQVQTVADTERMTVAKRALAEEAKRQSEERAETLRIETEKSERDSLLLKAEEASHRKLAAKASLQSESSAEPSKTTAETLSVPAKTNQGALGSVIDEQQPANPDDVPKDSGPAVDGQPPTTKHGDGRKGPEPAANKQPPTTKHGDGRKGPEPVANKQPPTTKHGDGRKGPEPAANKQPPTTKRGDGRKGPEPAANKQPPTTKRGDGRKGPEPAANKQPPTAKRGDGRKGPEPVADGRKNTDRKRRDGGERGRQSKGGRSSRTELHVPDEKSGRRRKPIKNRTFIAHQPTRHGFEMPTAPMIREIAIPETISVSDLAQKMSIKATQLIKTMIDMGIMATINQTIDQETAHIIVEELGHQAILINDASIEDEVFKVTETDSRDAVPRAPVVTVMGHVDHGKTSLLDYIRKSKIATTEAGGITQNIGAYRIDTDAGPITFLDTPGHSAFTAMRARGAKATDIVVLVVAADDGVMPQTVEAITHANAANVPIIVAVNKCDREEADPRRIRQQLTVHGIISEEIGGETIFVNVSAITGDGVSTLLESIALQSEFLELKAPNTGIASGIVLESRLEQGRGSVATVLVQKGQLSKGDMLLAGQEFGRVRRLYDEDGKEVAQAGPSTPIEVLGLSAPPHAGDEAIVVKDGRKVRNIAEYRQANQREARLARQHATRLTNVFDRMTGNEAVSLNIVVKAEMQGSIDALHDSLVQLSNDEVKVNVISAAIGGISETDVNLALSSDAIIIGFNVRANTAARKIIDTENIKPYYYSVIYHVLDAVKEVVTGKLSPRFDEQMLGVAEVLEVFRSKRWGNIAGCRVTEGVIRRQFPIRVLRDHAVIYEGELESLRRFQDNVNEVHVGTDCGIGVRNYNDIKVGDQIEVFERVSVKRI